MTNCGSGRPWTHDATQRRTTQRRRNETTSTTFKTGLVPWALLYFAGGVATETTARVASRVNGAPPPQQHQQQRPFATNATTASIPSSSSTLLPSPAISSTTTTTRASASLRTSVEDRALVDIQPRIVGGTLAAAGEFPWYVSPTDSFYCGGSLIHEDVVLTAAHCDLAYVVGGVVYVGGYLRGSAAGGATRNVIEQLVPHPRYDEDTVAYDYMLIKLRDPVRDVTPIRLNTDDDIPRSQADVTVMGYGLLEEGGSVTLRLNKVDLKAVGHETCAAAYVGVTRIRRDIMMCAGDVVGGRGACQGDSGGPLILQDGTQVGIVSFGVGCAQGAYPGVYSRVSGAYDWIQDTLCALSDNPPAGCPNDGTVVIPTQAPTPSGPIPGVNSGFKDVKIVVQYDDEPDQTSFLISQRGRVIYTGPVDYVPGPGEKWQTRFPEFPVGEFGFTMRDSAGNGMRSGDKPGFYEIWQVEGDREALLASGDAEFWYSTSVRFTVYERLPEGLPTPQPPDEGTTFQPTMAPTRVPTVCKCAPGDASRCVESECAAYSDNSALCVAAGNCIFESATDGSNPDQDGDQGEESESFLQANLPLLIIGAAGLVAVAVAILMGCCIWKKYRKPKRSHVPAVVPASNVVRPSRSSKQRNGNLNGVERPNMSSLAMEASRGGKANSENRRSAAANHAHGGRGYSTSASSGIDDDGLAWEDV